MRNQQPNTDSVPSAMCRCEVGRSAHQLLMILEDLAGSAPCHQLQLRRRPFGRVLINGRWFCETGPETGLPLAAAELEDAFDDVSVEHGCVSARRPARSVCASLPGILHDAA